MPVTRIKWINTLAKKASPSEGAVVPDNARLNADGSPRLNADGTYRLNE